MPLGATPCWRVGALSSSATPVGSRSLAPFLPGHPVTGAELLWAVRHEGALDEADVLDRRTRIGVVPADREAALETVRNLVGEGLVRKG